uniref:Uncharacterized protein n=1 Tax=Rhizophora mucronata TaxID=61149 RepID=A0A2P2N889_RHIMU
MLYRPKLNSFLTNSFNFTTRILRKDRHEVTKGNRKRSRRALGYIQQPY